MDIILILMTILLVLYFTKNIFTTYNEILYIESDLDNKKYIIRRGNLKNKEFLKGSANRLAEINMRVTKLIDNLKITYEEDKTKSYFIQKLITNYNSYILSEAAIDPRYTTYTVNKKDMHICLRTRDNNEELYDTNLLMYVVLHELAHLCNYDTNGNPIQGHGQEFRQIFQFLVTEAIKLNVYEYVDYTQNPKEYCGITISTTIVPRLNNLKLFV
jgi:predicted metal-dependent hydrolase